MFIGVREPLPLAGFPEGRVRLRLRNNSFAMAYVKTKDGIRCFVIGEMDGMWVPVTEFEQGRNVRLNFPAADVQKNGLVWGGDRQSGPTIGIKISGTATADGEEQAERTEPVHG